MYKVVAAFIIVFLLLIASTLTAQAETIHMKFQLAVDVRLDSHQKYQLFSFSPLQGETWTMVVYGLDENTAPTLTLLSANGTTLQENLNPEGSPVAYLSIPIEMSGMHLLMVSFQGQTGGMMRVMLFEGAPVNENITLLDTVFPTEPNRAFMVAGDSADPIDLGLETVPPSSDPSITPQIYASRGDSTSLPPIEERTTPVERVAWVNDNGETFYTLHIGTVPDATAYKTDGLLAFAQPYTGVFDFLVKVRAGSEIPVRVERPTCNETIVTSGGTLRAGPGSGYRPTGQLSVGTNIEITGTDATGDWLQIVDPNRPVGNSWIPNPDSYDLSRDDCERVEPVYAPPLNNPALTTLNTANLIVSLNFACDQTESFAGAYAAIQAGLGFLLPDLEFVLGQLQAVSCNSGNGGTGNLPGNLPGLGGNVPNPPTGNPVPPQPPVCVDGVNSTIVLYDSPYGESNQPPGVNDYTGGANCETVYANNNPNSIDTGAGNDFILTYGGNDTIYAGAGNDVVNAGDGDDWIRGGTGDDIIDGGNGTDTFDASDNPNNQIVNLVNGRAFGSVDILVNIENIVTGSGNDNILGNASANILDSGAGDDVLDGGAGNDTLLAGAGNDLLISGPGADVLDGGDGDDTFMIFGPQEAGDVVTGGTGFNIFRFGTGTTGSLTINSTGTDTLDFSLFGMGITIDLNLNTQIIGGLTLTLTNPVNTVIGTAFNDNITGNSAANEIHGMEGDDIIDGRAGDDTLFGGTGSDTIEGGSGGDSLYGGWENNGVNRDDIGSDTLNDNIEDGTLNLLYGGNHNFNGGNGNDQNDSLTTVSGWEYGGNLNETGSTGHDGDDTLEVTGNINDDRLYGGNYNRFGGIGDDGNDTITNSGNGNLNFLFGGNHNDTNGQGSDGNDILLDQGGNGDRLYGGNDNSNVGIGDDGSDQVTDGGGAGDIVQGGNLNVDSGEGNDNVGGGIDTVNSNDGLNDTVRGDNDNSEISPGEGLGTGTGSGADTLNCNPGDVCTQGNTP